MILVIEMECESEVIRELDSLREELSREVERLEKEANFNSDNPEYAFRLLHKAEGLRAASSRIINRIFKYRE